MVSATKDRACRWYVKIEKERVREYCKKYRLVYECNADDAVEESLGHHSGSCSFASRAS